MTREEFVPAEHPEFAAAMENVCGAFQRIRDAYVEAAREFFGALPPRRDQFALAPPHPNPTTREEILAWRRRPRAWHAFSYQPQREPRRNHRAGPDPRRLSVHHTPTRAGRRP